MNRKILMQKEGRNTSHVYQPAMQKVDNNPALEFALRHALRSPLKKYTPGHFAALALRNIRYYFRRGTALLYLGQ